MKRIATWSLAALLAAGAWASVRAEDMAPAAAAGDAKPAKKDKAVKLVKPWKDLASLTDDQKEKIGAVHAKALEARNAIDDKEQADVTALLTDAQKTELKDLLDKEKADKKTAKKKPTAEEDATAAAATAPAAK